MEFNISSEEKIKSITAVISHNEIDLYQTLVTAGYNPEDFDESTYVVPEDAYPMSIYHKIEGLLEKLTILRAMLAAI